MIRFGRRIGDTHKGPATYIAPNASVVGKIAGNGHYIVCGSVEGDCDIEGPVTLAEGGRWTGTLRATDVVIAGSVDGDVFASDRVEIASTAQVTGSISGLSIAVAEGAVIEGEIKVTSGQEPKRFVEKRKPSSEQS
jgi:cytoskeletal protein CcmA (bactofilin family)